MLRRALVISSKIALRAALARVLQSLGYSVELADSQKRALEFADQGALDAAIVVGVQWTKLAQRLRRKVPRTIVLDDGSRDIEAQLLDQLPHALALHHKRGDKSAGAPAILKVQHGTLDPSDRIFRDEDGRQVRLTRAEVALLATLMDNSYHVWSRAELRHAAFGRGTEPYDRSIDMLVARLRRKIEHDPKAPRLIVTVPGLGYKFTAHEPGEKRNGTLAAPEVQNSARENSVRENSVKEPYKQPTIATPHARNLALTNGRAERRQLTVVCCSLGQSTRFASHLDPEDFDELLRRFHNVCATVSAQWGGLVISSLGSDVTAIFGYPHGHEDDAERAVHSAVALLSKNGDLLPSPDARLEMRIGVATSLTLVSGDQSVVGEAILLAPRLANTAPANSVVVAESTCKLLGNVFDRESLGSFELKGVLDPVRAYRIRGKQPIESLFFARRTKEFTTFVGRDRELKQLATLWERTKGGKGQVVLVSGEAGIGKSRLCEVFLQHIADQSHYVLRYQCTPYHRNTPFYPVINHLERAARFEPGDMADAKVSKLEALLVKADASKLDVLLHTALLSIPTDRRQLLPELTPQRQRELTIAALIRQTIFFPVNDQW
jgi:class 3 adenylate cyclase/DNA-binding response OmpR family regulator